MSAFLDTVNIVSIAIVLSVIVEIGRLTLLDWRTITISINHLSDCNFLLQEIEYSLPHFWVEQY
jgi:hypothetical protein